MTPPRRINFDRLARPYRLLEYLAFGRDLERARFCLLDRLADRRSILVLGEGDGRCVARLLTLAPQAQVHVIDSSRAMIEQARARIESGGAQVRVTFECADACVCDFGESRYDAVVTCFFLDCFEAGAAEQIIRGVSRSLRAEALWLFADFVLPDRGVFRLRSRIWLAGLYFFFRWQTGLPTRSLPPSETLIAAEGFSPQTTRTRQAGLLRSVLFERAQRCRAVTAV